MEATGTPRPLGQRLHLRPTDPPPPRKISGARPSTASRHARSRPRPVAAQAAATALWIVSARACRMSGAISASRLRSAGGHGCWKAPCHHRAPAARSTRRPLGRRLQDIELVGISCSGPWPAVNLLGSAPTSQHRRWSGVRRAPWSSAGPAGRPNRPAARRLPAQRRAPLRRRPARAGYGSVQRIADIEQRIEQVVALDARRQ